jgi:hypothetical protein
MTSLRLVPHRYSNQNLILEKLQAEAIDIHSMPMLYIPRRLVAEDGILGEDRLSEFKYAYPINVYVENVDGFTGQNSFASKFGLQIDSGAVFQIAKSTWGKTVGLAETGILPNRPAEGDLIYANFSKGLFEITFVDHQSPFYQLGQFYTYKLNVELFRYSSEKLDTGIPEVDMFEDKLTQDRAIRTDPDTAPQVGGADNSKFKDKASEFIVNTNNPFGNF